MLACGFHSNIFLSQLSSLLLLEEMFILSFSLFPQMPRHNYYKVAPLVNSLCTKHGVEYKVKPLLTAFKDIVR